MPTPKQLDFSSPGGVDSDNTSPPPPSSLSRRKSPRKSALKRAVVPEEENKNKNKKLGSPINRIWNEKDELAILKGLVAYRAKTGLQPKSDWDAFFCFVRDSIGAKVSKEQLLNKIRKLKRKYLVNLEKIDQGNDPLFTRTSDSEAYGVSKMFWGKNKAEFVKGGMDKAQQSESGEETLKEDEEVANAEPVHENGAAKRDSVDKITENGTAAKESHDDDDELCAVRDAFEATMLQGLSDYQKKLQLEKLMSLGTGKRKELSNEWKALWAEEAKLHIKKLRFSAKLSEAANK